MKIAAMALMAAMVGAAAEPGQSQQRLTVYLLDNASVPPALRLPAMRSAAEMLATIGIRLDWRNGEPRRTSSGRPILIELARRAPATLLPSAFAYALPYEGVHIRVFYDRIERQIAPGLTTAVLAHVLVHEITHVLERVARHSDSGIMKAVWSDEDYLQMRSGPLPFAPEDRELIRLGMAR
jgi:hypothetical protein